MKALLTKLPNHPPLSAIWKDAQYAARVLYVLQKCSEIILYIHSILISIIIINVLDKRSGLAFKEWDPHELGSYGRVDRSVSRQGVGQQYTICKYDIKR